MDPLTSTFRSSANAALSSPEMASEGAAFSSLRLAPLRAAVASPAGGLSSPGGASALEGDLVDEISAQMDALADNPSLRDMYYLIIALLKKLGGDAVRDFVKSMHAALGNDGLSHGQPSSTAGSTSTLSVLSTFEVHVEKITAQVNVLSADGSTAVSATLSSLRVEIKTSITVVRRAMGGSPEDPLALDLNGDGAINLDRARRFDLSGKGEAAPIPFVSGGDAFLALDRNENGRIDDGTELFGDQHGAAHGFEELRRFDSNGDGAIDARDAVYDRLRLLGDFDGDGDDEQRGLADAGVTRIDLASQAEGRALGPSATLAQAGRFWRGDRADLAGSLLLRRV